jgi:hypothetical protein
MMGAKDVLIAASLPEEQAVINLRIAKSYG